MSSEPDIFASDERRGGLLLTVLLTLSFAFLRFGYDYGVSDQGEFLPLIMHRLDPDILGADWFVKLQDLHLNVRSGFVLMLEVPAHVLPLWLIVLIAHAGGLALAASAIYRLAFHASRAAAPAAFATVLVLVGTPHWTLGANMIAAGMLVPSVAAWGLGLWSLVFLFEQKFALSGVLLGLAALFQPLVALHLFLLGGAWLVVAAVRTTIGGTRGFGGRPLRYVAGFLLAGGWFPALLVLQQLAGATGIDATDVLTRFRAPHHYRPEAFPATHFVKFGLVMFVGLPALLALRAERDTEYAHFAGTLLAIIGCLLAVAMAGIFVLDSNLIVKLQLFKLTVPAKALLLIAATAALWRRMPARLTASLSHLYPGRLASILTACLAVGLAVAVLTVPRARNRLLPFTAREASPEGESVEWIRRATHPQDVFAIPPSLSGFRNRAERAVFVDFKAVPHQDDALLEWYRRLMIQSPVDPATRGGVPAMNALDESYERMGVETVLALVRKEGVSYFMRTTAFPDVASETGLRLAFHNSGWWIYASPTLPAEVP